MNDRQGRATDLWSAVRAAPLEGGQDVAATASLVNRLVGWSPRPAVEAAAGRG